MRERARKKRKMRTEDRCRVADEGNSHLDSRAIKVRLRKPKKRLARKEWNLIRNSCSLVLPAMKKQERERTGHQVDTRKEIGRKSVGRVEIIQPYNSREREIGKESEKEHKTEKR